jgi:hypothetical protein
VLDLVLGFETLGCQIHALDAVCLTDLRCVTKSEELRTCLKISAKTAIAALWRSLAGAGDCLEEDDDEVWRVPLLRLNISLSSLYLREP